MSGRVGEKRVRLEAECSQSCQVEDEPKRSCVEMRENGQHHVGFEADVACFSQPKTTSQSITIASSCAASSNSADGALFSVLKSHDGMCNEKHPPSREPSNMSMLLALTPPRARSQQNLPASTPPPDPVSPSLMLALSPSLSPMGAKQHRPSARSPQGSASPRKHLWSHKSKSPAKSHHSASRDAGAESGTAVKTQILEGKRGANECPCAWGVPLESKLG